jgi:hypothetical protein
VIAVISASTLARGRLVLPRARVAARSSSFLPGLARVVPSNPQARTRQVREVVLGVLPGVEDHRHVREAVIAGRAAGRGSDRLVLAAELADHRGELGGIRPVAGVSVPGQRDPAVAGDYQAQADDPQVGPLLLGLAALGNRRLAVRRVDEGGEVGHVQGHRRAVQPGQVRDPHGDRLADLLQLPGVTACIASQNRR